MQGCKECILLLDGPLLRLSMYVDLMIEILRWHKVHRFVNVQHCWDPVLR